MPSQKKDRIEHGRCQSSMERHKLVEEFGLKPRDIAALWSPSGGRTGGEYWR